MATISVRPGATTADIDTVITDHFARCGRRAAVHELSESGSWQSAFPAATCTSVNEQVVHGIPNNKPLAEGDIVSVDTGLPAQWLVWRLGKDLSRGPNLPAAEQLLDVTQGTLNLAFELMHTKSRWSQVAREMADYVRDNGFSTVECFVGHGIGRQMHEEPQVPNFLSRGLRGSGDFRIEPGLVIAVEPMVNMGTKRVKMLSDHWTQITLDRKPSAHFEHTIAMTNNGPWLLTAAPTPGGNRQFALGGRGKRIDQAGGLAWLMCGWRRVGTAGKWGKQRAFRESKTRQFQPLN